MLPLQTFLSSFCFLQSASKLRLDESTFMAIPLQPLADRSASCHASQPVILACTCFQDYTEHVKSHTAFMCAKPLPCKHMTFK